MNSSNGISYSSGTSYFDRHTKTEGVQDRSSLAYAGLVLFCKHITSLKGVTDEGARKSRLDWLDYCKDINKGKEGKPAVRIDSGHLEPLSRAEYEEVVSGSVKRMMKTKNPFIVPVTAKNVKPPKREKDSVAGLDKECCPVTAYYEYLLKPHQDLLRERFELGIKVANFQFARERGHDGEALAFWFERVNQWLSSDFMITEDVKKIRRRRYIETRQWGEEAIRLLRDESRWGSQAQRETTSFLLHWHQVFARSLHLSADLNPVPRRWMWDEWFRREYQTPKAKWQAEHRHRRTWKSLHLILMGRPKSIDASTSQLERAMEPLYWLRKDLERQITESVRRDTRGVSLIRTGRTELVPRYSPVRAFGVGGLSFPCLYRGARFANGWQSVKLASHIRVIPSGRIRVLPSSEPVSAAVILYRQQRLIHITAGLMVVLGFRVDWKLVFGTPEQTPVKGDPRCTWHSAIVPDDNISLKLADQCSATVPVRFLRSVKSHVEHGTFANYSKSEGKRTKGALERLLGPIIVDRLSQYHVRPRCAPGTCAGCNAAKFFDFFLYSGDWKNPGIFPPAFLAPKNGGYLSFQKRARGSMKQAQIYSGEKKERHLLQHALRGLRGSGQIECPDCQTKRFGDETAGIEPTPFFTYLKGECDDCRALRDDGQTWMRLVAVLHALREMAYNVTERQSDWALDPPEDANLPSSFSAKLADVSLDVEYAWGFDGDDDAESWTPPHRIG